MARWTVGGMILSSIPNPAARKQAIDKALHEASREAERHYTSVREDLKREGELRKRQREFDFTQRVACAKFSANPEDRQFEVRMAANDQYQSGFQRSEEYRAYKDYEKTSNENKANEVNTLKNRAMLRQRSDVEGHKIDKMEQVGMQKIQMEAESKKMMLDAAMRLPVRGGLEESYSMLNDELIKQGEAQRLGGDMQQVELSDKSLKPVLDRLDKMFLKLEDKLQTGVSVRVS